MKGTLDLIAADAQQQGDEDDPQQPGIFYEQSAGHREEVLLEHGPQDSQYGGKCDHGGSHDDARALLQEFG